jgi:conjugal transfer ATP-binding protein TraC
MKSVLDLLIQPVKTFFGLGEEGGYTPTPIKAMAQITQAESFAALLPYTSFMPTENIFVLDSGGRDPKSQPNALGFVLEVSPQTGASEEMASILNAVFSPAQEGAHVQVSLYASPRIIDKLKVAALLRDAADHRTDPEDRRSKNVYRTMSRRRTDFYLRGALQQLFPSFPFLIRDFRVIVSISRPGSPMSRQEVDHLIRLREGLRSTLKAGGFPSVVWDADNLINWNYELLNPHKMYSRDGQQHRRYDEGRLIRHQIVDRDTICRPSDDGRSLTYSTPGNPVTSCSRLYTVASYPASFQLWSMGNLIGDFYQGQLGYPCPFVITLGAHILDVPSNKAVADLRAARATANLSSQMARFNPAMPQQKKDWDTVLESYDSGNGEVLMYHQVLLMAPEHDIDVAESAARAIWRARGFELVSDQFMQVPGLLGSLPMGYTTTMHQFYQRTGRVTRKITDNCVNLSPMIGEWKGTRRPVLQLIGRRGQLMGLDLFDNKQGNYNFAIAASSGSGKSVLANELAISYLGIGAKVWIIDVGRSYEKLSQVLGGEFIEFRPDRPICINPFDQIKDINEDMEILKPMVAQMISPSGDLGDFERSLIEIAIRDTWDQHGLAMTITVNHPGF